jgi:calcium channel MID1
MQFPKLTPLQSRLAASLAASAILVIVYLALSFHHFAYAAELDSLLQEDHNHHRLDALLHAKTLEGLDLDDDTNDNDEGHVGYEAEFLGVSRDIIGRAEAGVDALFNNVVNQMDINPGLTHNYVFSKDQVFGNHTDPGEGLPSVLQGRSVKLDEHEAFLPELAESELEEEEDAEIMRERLISRQAQQTVYISINTCRQPTSNGTVSSNPPQLTLYISTSETNQKPGPDSINGLATSPIPLQGGFANYTFNATGDVYIGVFSPELPVNFSGNWHFEIAASIDGLYHNYNGDTPFLFFVDSDINSALFVTDNLTNASSSTELDMQWMDLGTPFTMFAFSQNNTAIKGLENSFCGLRQQATVENLQVTTSMTTRGMGNQPKEQFYVQGLNGSSTYYGYLAMIGNGTKEGPNVPNGAVVGGGGQVWQAMNFTTKAGMSS